MAIIIAIISIFGIAGLTWLLNRFLNLKICPICAGVSGTWFWMLIGIISGQLSVISYQLSVAILMGGSVVGIAYQIEKRLPQSRSPLLWKTLFIPTGFAAVYSVLASWWFMLIILAVFLFILTLIFVGRMKSKIISEEQNRKIAELEDEMKNCC